MKCDSSALNFMVVCESFGIWMLAVFTLPLYERILNGMVDAFSVCWTLRVFYTNNTNKEMLLATFGHAFM